MIFNLLQKIRRHSSKPERKCARWPEAMGQVDTVRRICDHLKQNDGLVAVAKSHKVLVFCEFLSGLDVLAVGLESTCPEQPILRIDGQSSAKSKDEAIKDVMQGPRQRIMLVTFSAGSEAIDLSAADYVLFLHPIWNPAQMYQCIARAYRHGQEEQVKARILMANESIETYVYKIQDQKRKKDPLLKTPSDPKTREQVQARTYLTLSSTIAENLALDGSVLVRRRGWIELLFIYI